jgi:hypothetical protein
MSVPRHVPPLRLAAGAVLVLAATATTAVAPAVADAATPDQITALTSLSGSHTAVTLDPATVAALTKLGVSLAPTGTASLSGGSISFPITAGYVEIHSDHAVKPGWIEGSIQHDGSGFSLTGGGTTVTLGNFSVDPGDSLLTGTVDGKAAVPLLSLDGSKVKVSVSGGDVHLDGTVAELTATAASALDTAFHTTALAAGLPLGTVHLVADATAEHPFPASDVAMSVPHLPGGATTYALTPAALATFAQASVTIAPTGSATETPPGASGATLSFPVTGGMLVEHKNHAYRPGYIDGSIPHEGSGLTFSGPGGTLAATNLVFDPGDSLETATVGTDSRFPLLFIDGTNIKAQVAKLTPQAAARLDQTFATTVFTPYLSLGLMGQGS